MAWYDVGSVAVTNNSTTVTGTGTDFISGAQVGEALYINDDLYEIAVINSSTQLTLADPYLGATASGLSYKIIPTQSLVADLSAGVADLISDFADVRDYAGNGKFNDGTEASPAITFTQDQNNGLYRIGSDNWGLVAGGVKQLGISTSGVELSQLNIGGDVVTASVNEINILDGLTATTAELNFVDGVTSNIQTQLDGKATTAQGLLADSAVQQGDDVNFGALTATSHGDITSTSIVTGEASASALDLTAIAQTKAENAVDVFVYDTSKDSDGGAWRHRTQHTSWYNETLNTATRGSRKEFPSVAVLVLNNNKLIIYDGDDPSLPVWMVFNGNTTEGNTSTAVPLSANKSVYALNGRVCIGNSDTGSWYRGLWVQDFISDKTLRYTGFLNQKPSGISKRNTVELFTVIDSTGGILFSPVNDVAMTVLPDAPIDQATQLPIPTIAVATDGGVSVIKDDGTVADLDGLIESNNNSGHVALDADGNVWFTSRQNSAGLFNGIQYFGNVSGTTDASVADDLFVDISRSAYASAPYFKEKNTQMLSNAWAGNYGLTKVAQDYSNRDATMFAEVTSTYNTGWMNGDIKLATLSDTDDTDLVGTNLLSAGTFDSSTGWTLGEGWSISGGVATHNLSATNTNLTHEVSVEVGKMYFMEIEVLSLSTNGSIGLYTLYGADRTTAVYTQSTGKYVLSFTALSTSVGVTARAFAGTTCTIDNFKVYRAEPDRSVNNNGLQVFGTVQKSPVATGADLVAYSGFNASNYLKQPYNNDLDFGIGDFCIMGWAKASGTSVDYIVSTYPNDGTSGGFFLAKVSDNTLTLSTRESGIGSEISSNVSLPDGVWSYVCAVVSNSGTLQKIYINGELSNSSSVTARNITNSGSLIVGLRGDEVTSSWAGDLALLRISATAPTAEQIERIYQDEKNLFVEDAKCTLTGTSDAVTALAYDSDTELLHVGSSSGRSVFSGLRRVDETNTSVTTSISASNGMVVEQ